MQLWKCKMIYTLQRLKKMLRWWEPISRQFLQWRSSAMNEHWALVELLLLLLLAVHSWPYLGRSSSSVQTASLLGLPGLIHIIVVLVRRARKNCPTINWFNFGSGGGLRRAAIDSTCTTPPPVHGQWSVRAVVSQWRQQCTEYIDRSTAQKHVSHHSENLV